MKDIDFDELDRAVSSVLGQPPTDDAQARTSVTPAPAPTPTSRAEPTPATSISPQKDLAQKRRSGRFMDVVPSSRVKGSSQNPKPVVSRQGTNIAPISESVVAPAAPGPAEEKPAVASQVDSGQPKKPTSEQDEAHEAMVGAADELAGLSGLMYSGEESSPIDTPFVSDYDVKKRPLGAFSVGGTDQTLLDENAKRYRDSVAKDEVSSSGDSPAEIDTHMNDAIARELRGHDQPEEDKSSNKKSESQLEKADSSQDNESAATPDQLASAGSDELPGELQDEMLAIASKPVGEVAAVEPKFEPVQAPIPTPSPVKSEASKPPVTISDGSITQQYKSESKSQSEEITPVFDTDSYHKPLAHAKKKKSGWLSVILITTLIILGAGAGTAMYIFDPFGLL